MQTPVRLKLSLLNLNPVIPVQAGIHFCLPRNIGRVKPGQALRFTWNGCRLGGRHDEDLTGMTE
jgi:hypothetical protein